MSEKERMNRHTHNRSRIARSLHEDATRSIGGDLNLWPQVRARVIEKQEAAARATSGLSARAEPEETWVRRGEGIQAPPRER